MIYPRKLVAYMERVYRLTLTGGLECTVIAKDANAAREQAKAKYNLPVVKTICDLYTSDLGEAAENKKKELTSKMQQLAAEFIDFLKKTEQDGMEELVDYKFFTNINHCHVALAFSSLVDERNLKEQADNLYNVISESFATEKEKIALLVDNVRTIDVYRIDEVEPMFSLTRKKSNWEKNNHSETNFGCIVDKNKMFCNRCDNSYNCFGVKTIFTDKEVLNLLEENTFEVDYLFNTADLIIKAKLL